MAKDFSLTKYFREQYINEFKSNAQKETSAMRSSTFTAYDEDGEQPYLNEKSIEDLRRVSAPRAKKDKNNPNFLNVFIDYDIGPGGATMAFGQETMTGQIRRLSSERARLIMNNIATMLQNKYDIEDIEVTDLENGKVKLFAVSDDFIDMKGDEFGDFGLPGNLKEIDVNDPALVKARAAKDQMNKLKSNPKPNFDEVLDLRDEKGDLERRIKNLYREMESDPDVEAEGGAVADQYGDELNKLETRLLKVKKQIALYDMNEGEDEDDEQDMADIKADIDSMMNESEDKWNAIDVSRKAEKEVDNKEWNSRTAAKLDMLIALNAAGKFKKDFDEERLQGWVDQNYSWEKLSRQFKVNEGSCGYGPDGVPGDTPGETKGMDADDRTRTMLRKLIQKEIAKHENK